MAELVSLAPEVILSHSPPATSALSKATRSIPIVFVQITDPVGAGLVANLALPGANITANSGLMVMPDSITLIHRKLIVSLAERFRLPAIYPFRYFSDDGGLISYGIDLADVWRRSATYVDRILKGSEAGDRPVQQPTKF